MTHYTISAQRVPFYITQNPDMKGLTFRAFERFSNANVFSRCTCCVSAILPAGKIAYRDAAVILVVKHELCAGVVSRGIASSGSSQLQADRTVGFACLLNSMPQESNFLLPWRCPRAP